MTLYEFNSANFYVSVKFVYYYNYAFHNKIHFYTSNTKMGEFDDHSLHSLTNTTPHYSPKLLAWISKICKWFNDNDHKLKTRAFFYTVRQTYRKAEYLIKSRLLFPKIFWSDSHLDRILSPVICYYCKTCSGENIMNLF